MSIFCSRGTPPDLMNENLLSQPTLSLSQGMMVTRGVRYCVHHSNLLNTISNSLSNSLHAMSNLLHAVSNLLHAISNLLHAISPALHAISTLLHAISGDHGDARRERHHPRVPHPEQQAGALTPLFLSLPPSSSLSPSLSLSLSRSLSCARSLSIPELQVQLSSCPHSV